MVTRKVQRSDLEKRLGYHFDEPDLIETALTHVSASSDERSYQRLEFLGDRVLGLAIASILIETFPFATEGEMSQRLSQLVRRESCAALAAAWDVGPHLKLGPGESRSGGRRNVAILADVAEAIIGAVYLDGGWDEALNLVRRSYADDVLTTLATSRDAKTALQEWAQGQGLAPPVYRLIERTGPDHAPCFDVSAELTGRELAVGRGRSKRAAEQDAAETMLRREGLWGGMPPVGEAAHV